MITLSTIKPHLLYEFKSDHDLVTAINEISHNFTRDRTAIDVYLSDERLVSAYVAFYCLTNIPKLEAVMKYFSGDFFETLKTANFIDVGAGPGTFSIAWRELTGRSSLQIETSFLMKKAAQKLWQGLYPDLPMMTEAPGPRVLFFGHSANEMKLEGVKTYLKQYQPEHVIFIEPGTRDFFAEMLKIREYLLRLDYDVIYPCPGPNPCPMDGTENWCHQFVQVRQDPEVERLSQMARKDRKLLPLTVQAFSRTFKKDTMPIRIVRVLPETKFSFEWEVCEANVLVSYQVMKRNLSRDKEKLYASVLAGAAVEVEVEKIIGASKRVKVIKLH